MGSNPIWSTMKNPVMYIIANKGLGMSPGKLAAQVAHAAVRSVWNDERANVKEWLAKGETKIVLEARDTEHMMTAERYLEHRGFPTYLVIDEGRTEIPAHSVTALASQIVDKDLDDTRFAFADFNTYKIEDPVVKLRVEVDSFVQAVKEVTLPDTWRRIHDRAMDLRVGR